MTIHRCPECSLVMQSCDTPDKEGWYTCDKCGVRFREADHNLIEYLNEIDNHAKLLDVNPEL